MKLLGLVLNKKPLNGDADIEACAFKDDVQIGANAVIAREAVVTKNIAEKSIVEGKPVR